LLKMGRPPLVVSVWELPTTTTITHATIVEQAFREIRAFRIYDGPTEVHKWSLTQTVDGRFAPMRRTKAAQIYRKTLNLRAVQLLLGRTKLESTVRYLGIEIDDALSVIRPAIVAGRMTD
jgi:hypothetical protein